MNINYAVGPEFRPIIFPPEFTYFFCRNLLTQSLTAKLKKERIKLEGLTKTSLLPAQPCNKKWIFASSVPGKNPARIQNHKWYPCFFHSHHTCEQWGQWSVWNWRLPWSAICLDTSFTHWSRVASSMQKHEVLTVSIISRRQFWQVLWDLSPPLATPKRSIVVSHDWLWKLRGNFVQMQWFPMDGRWFVHLSFSDRCLLAASH